MNFKEWLKPKPIHWKQTLATLAIVCLCSFTGFITGFYAGTGTLPIFTNSPDIACPDIAKPSLDEVQTTLTEMLDREYEEGYNCVDFAWDATRALAWQGQPSAIVGIAFDTGPNHALLIVATTDQGWAYIEPQAGIRVYPRVGGIYDGRTIVEMRVLVMHWVDYLEWQLDPIFEEIENE